MFISGKELEFGDGGTAELMMMLETAVLSYCHEEYIMKEKEFGLTLIKNLKGKTT